MPHGVLGHHVVSQNPPCKYRHLVLLNKHKVSILAVQQMLWHTVALLRYYRKILDMAQ
jgi:hypothetical protein